MYNCVPDYIQSVFVNGCVDVFYTVVSQASSVFAGIV